MCTSARTAPAACITFTATFNAAIKTDGTEIQWQRAAAIGKEGTDRGEYAAQTRFAWDENNLYLKVDVTDGVQFDCLNKDKLWDWDSLQIGFAPDRTDNSRYFVFTIGRYNGKVRMFMDGDEHHRLPRGEGHEHESSACGHHARRAQTQTTTYELTISWSKFFGLSEAPAGKTIGFDIVVNDRDEAIAEGKEPGQWSRYFIEYYGGIAERTASREIRQPDPAGRCVYASGCGSIRAERGAGRGKVDRLRRPTPRKRSRRWRRPSARRRLCWRKHPAADRQNEVDEAVKALRDSIDALQKRQEEPKPTPAPVQPGKGNGTGGKNDDPFRDVSKNDWYHDAVAYVYENGLMSGTSRTGFEPRCGDDARHDRDDPLASGRKARLSSITRKCAFEDVASGSCSEGGPLGGKHRRR